MAAIDPAARVAEGVTIEPNVSIGPFCTIGPDVVLREGVRLLGHVSITGHTTVGARTVVHPFVSLGSPPQMIASGVSFAARGRSDITARPGRKTRPHRVGKLPWSAAAIRRRG